jgi:histidinol-phosphate aminotransferase
MQGYVSGEQPDDDRIIKLNTNENPYPPSPEVDAVIQGFVADELQRYPPPTADNFRQVASKIHNLKPENIMATRGGDELLRLVITTFVEPGELIAMSDPTYSLYPVLAQIQDCPIQQIPLNPDWSLPADFAAKANQAKAKLTFIVNPNAPSGHLTSVATIRTLASDLHSIVLIDEAYIDFVAPTREHNCLHLIEEFDNLIFLRTLSKGYSLAGLRFGYGIAHADLIRPMIEKTRDSYNLDLFSQRIATAALADQGYAQQNWEKVRSERKRLTTELLKMNFSLPESNANFLLVTVGEKFRLSASEIYLQLKQQHIFIRYFDVPGLDDKIRITVGTHEENDLLLQALLKIL